MNLQKRSDCLLKYRDKELNSQRQKQLHEEGLIAKTVPTNKWNQLLLPLEIRTKAKLSVNCTEFKLSKFHYRIIGRKRDLNVQNIHMNGKNETNEIIKNKNRKIRFESNTSFSSVVFSSKLMR